MFRLLNIGDNSISYSNRIFDGFIQIPDDGNPYIYIESFPNYVLDINSLLRETKLKLYEINDVSKNNLKTIITTAGNLYIKTPIGTLLEILGYLKTLDLDMYSMILKDTNNNYIKDLTKEEFLNLLIEVSTIYINIFNYYENIKNLIYKATTLEELNNIIIDYNKFGDSHGA